MHVAVDARELAGRQTGVGRFLGCLLEHWSTMPEARRHRFTLYSHAPIRLPPHGWSGELRVLRGAGGTLWEQVTLAGALRWARPDVLFAPGYSAPLLGRTPIALAVHDVSFAAHPEWFRWREGRRRRLVTTLAARRARVVLTISRFSREEIVRHLGVAPERVRVVPLGVGLAGSDAARGAASRRSPLVLFVGSIFNRRHVASLVSAMPAVLARVPDARLAIVGDNRTWPREDPTAVAAALGIHDRVSVTSFVDDGRLRELYAEASVFAFLSEYEGFGLTPLEALAAGVPVVVLDTPVAREIYGAAAERVATPDPPAVADALVAVLTDAERRARLLSHAPAVLARHRWSDSAASTLAAIEEAARS